MFNKDAFSNGQVDSKLWLCRELERLEWTSKLTHIYGGWYGVLGFLLLSREKFQVNRIESFDRDPSCEPIANMINRNWIVKKKQFIAYTTNCNLPIPGNPDLIINTSTEHFDQMAWFDNIKPGTRVILQGNDLEHEDHVGNAEDLTDFENKYKLTSVAYKGTMDFVYPDWSFSRYTIIGIK